MIWPRLLHMGPAVCFILSHWYVPVSVLLDSNPEGSKAKSESVSLQSDTHSLNPNKRFQSSQYLGQKCINIPCCRLFSWASFWISAMARFSSSCSEEKKMYRQRTAVNNLTNARARKMSLHQSPLSFVMNKNILLHFTHLKWWLTCSPCPFTEIYLQTPNHFAI
jgi:hypothetical protein